MTGFKLRTSGVGIDRFANWATTTTPLVYVYATANKLYSVTTRLGKIVTTTSVTMDGVVANNRAWSQNRPIDKTREHIKIYLKADNKCYLCTIWISKILWFVLKLWGGVVFINNIRIDR